MDGDSTQTEDNIGSSLLQSDEDKAESLPGDLQSKYTELLKHFEESEDYLTKYRHKDVETMQRIAKNETDIDNLKNEVELFRNKYESKCMELENLKSLVKHESWKEEIDKQNAELKEWGDFFQLHEKQFHTQLAAVERKLSSTTCDLRNCKAENETLRKEKYELEKSREDLLTRLSKMAGTRLTYNNPAITDLSDENRGTKLAEQFNELYDTEWTDSIEELTNTGLSEEEAICVILKIVTSAFHMCKETAESYKHGIIDGPSTLPVLEMTDEITHLGDQISNKIELSEEIECQLREISRTLMPLFCANIEELYTQMLINILPKLIQEAKHTDTSNKKENSEDREIDAQKDGFSIKENLLERMPESQKENEITEFQNETNVQDERNQAYLGNAQQSVNDHNIDEEIAYSMDKTNKENKENIRGIDLMDGCASADENHSNSNKMLDNQAQDMCRLVDKGTDREETNPHLHEIPCEEAKKNIATEEGNIDGKEQKSVEGTKSEIVPGRELKMDYNKMNLDENITKDRNINEAMNTFDLSFDRFEQCNGLCEHENQNTVDLSFDSFEQCDGICEHENQNTVDLSFDRFEQCNGLCEHENQNTFDLSFDSFDQCDGVCEHGNSSFLEGQNICFVRKHQQEAHHKGETTFETTAFDESIDGNSPVGNFDKSVITETNIRTSGIGNSSLFDAVAMDEYKHDTRIEADEANSIANTKSTSSFNISEYQKTSMFALKCARLCWLMVIKDPPLSILSNCTMGNDFDSNLFRHYTRSGVKIGYIVWPALYLYENGPLLAKGVAQPLCR